MTRLDDCYARGLLRTVAPSEEKARASLARAREWLTEAKKSLGAGAVRSALSAVYMGYFHAARAVLFRDGVREKSHYCIGVYLDKYGEKGQLEEEWVALFDRYRKLREADQYDFGSRPTAQEAGSAIEGAGRFVARMEKLLADTR
jgi:uncharacterized protein (UPF0332 family)